MERNDLADKVLNYFRSLEGTVEYKTVSRIGFKINTKLYAEVHTGKSSARMNVNEKYLSEEDIKNLNLEVVPESFGWTLNTKVKITEESNLEDYFKIIKKCYEGTKKEYEDKLRAVINKAIEENPKYIRANMEMEEKYGEPGYYESSKVNREMWEEYRVLVYSGSYGDKKGSMSRYFGYAPDDQPFGNPVFL